MNMRTIGKFSVIILSGITILCMNGCIKKENVQLLGKWKDTSGNIIEFHPDSTITGGVFGEGPVPGKYSWLDDSHFQLTYMLWDLNPERANTIMNIPIVLSFEIIKLTNDSLKFTSQDITFSFHRIIN